MGARRGGSFAEIWKVLREDDSVVLAQIGTGRNPGNYLVTNWYTLLELRTLPGPVVNAAVACTCRCSSKLFCVVHRRPVDNEASELDACGIPPHAVVRSAGHLGHVLQRDDGRGIAHETGHGYGNRALEEYKNRWTSWKAELLGWEC